MLSLEYGISSNFWNQNKNQNFAYYNSTCNLIIIIIKPTKILQR